MFPCLFCAKELKTLQKRNRHHFTHLPWYFADHTCSVCKRKFECKGILNNHLVKTNHNDPDLFPRVDIFTLRRRYLQADTNSFSEEALLWLKKRSTNADMEPLTPEGADLNDSWALKGFNVQPTGLEACASSQSTSMFSLPEPPAKQHCNGVSYHSTGTLPGSSDTRLRELEKKVDALTESVSQCYEAIKDIPGLIEESKTSIQAYQHALSQALQTCLKQTPQQPKMSKESRQMLLHLAREAIRLCNGNDDESS